MSSWVEAEVKTPPKLPCKESVCLAGAEFQHTQRDLFLNHAHGRDSTTSSSNVRGCIGFSSLDFKAAETPGAGTPPCECSQAQNSRAFCVCLFLGYL